MILKRPCHPSCILTPAQVYIAHSLVDCACHATWRFVQDGTTYYTYTTSCNVQHTQYKVSCSCRLLVAINDLMLSSANLPITKLFIPSLPSIITPCQLDVATGYFAKLCKDSAATNFQVLTAVSHSLVLDILVEYWLSLAHGRGCDVSVWEEHKADRDEQVCSANAVCSYVK